MLTNPRDAFRGQSRSPKHSTIPHANILLVCNSNFVFKTRRFSDIRLQERRDLEMWVKGHTRSLEMLPFDRTHMTSY